MSENKYDILKMYFCEDYKVTEGLVIKQPTIGDIIEYGENKFWNVASTLCANPTSLRLELWNQGIDWNEISDFDLFISICQGLSKDMTEMIFGDVDFQKFESIENEDGKIVLVNLEKPEIQIDEDVYDNMVGYLRVMFNIFPKVEKAKNKATKEAIIFEEEMNIKNASRLEKKDKWNSSVLFPLISAALNHPGFKYKRTELKEIGLVEFMDSIKRLQIYESTTALMTGMYMGMVDTKQMDLSKELNWARDIYKD